ncbi:catalase-like domain-containing protein [Tuber indicum]|nr:catalase-like domain-containing protein [Tuber indicum]
MGIQKAGGECTDLAVTHLNAFLGNTVKQEGQFVYIKYHFICDQGSAQLAWADAIQRCGDDPDFSKRDLWQTIEKGEPVSWTAKARVMKPEEADRMQDFGRLVLNKNPENYHRDVEQSAFSPGSMVPGIEDSPDMLLQFRMVFYRDAQYHRIGINFHNVPVNCPFRSRSNASMSFGGPFRSDGNISGNPHYALNSFVNKFRPDTAEAPYGVSNNVVSRQGHYSKCTLGDYNQERELYVCAMSSRGHVGLHHNTAAALELVEYVIIQMKYLAQCYYIQPECARDIYDLLPKEFDFGKAEEKAEDAPSFGEERGLTSFRESLLLARRPAIRSSRKDSPSSTLSEELPQYSRKEGLARELKGVDLDTVCLIPLATGGNADMARAMLEATNEAGTPNLLSMSPASAGMAGLQKQPGLEEFINLEAAVLASKGGPGAAADLSPCVIRFERTHPLECWEGPPIIKLVG